MIGVCWYVEAWVARVHSTVECEHYSHKVSEWPNRASPYELNVRHVAECAIQWSRTKKCEEDLPDEA